jgi:predicted O-methyltransferase YrrM
VDENPWIDDYQLEVGGARFVATGVPLGHLDDQFIIVKPPDLVRRYLALLDAERPRRIVELGVKAGGSTALLALAAEPELLLAVDLEPEIPTRLAQLIETRGLGQRVITAFGLDQGDRAALTRFVDGHMQERGFDLVIDDASHVLGPTRTSFEVLFPRLRPGGLYVVEDWSSECVTASHLARLLPDSVDFKDRVGGVNHVLHILNSPEHDLPDAVKVSMTRVAAADHDDEAELVTRDLIDRIVDIAGRADLSALDGAPLGGSRPLADLAVELMMISAARPDLIEEVRVSGEWLSARRGTADLPLDQFRLDESWTDFFGYLT